MAEDTYIEGRVDDINDKGIKLDGAWHNFTRKEWREKPWDTPAVGDRVSLKMDQKKGEFVRAITIQRAAPPASASGGGGPTHAAPSATALPEEVVLSFLQRAAVQVGAAFGLGQVTPRDEPQVAAATAQALGAVLSTLLIALTQGRIVPEEYAAEVAPAQVSAPTGMAGYERAIAAAARYEDVQTLQGIINGDPNLNEDDRIVLRGQCIIRGKQLAQAA